MSDPKTKAPRWTAGQIITSKPLTTLALTAILAYNLLFKVIDPISTPLAEKLHITTGTREESIFVISLLVAGVIVSFIAAVILLLVVYSIVMARMEPAAAASWHAKSARPKWNIVYSLILGYIIFLVLFFVGSRTFSAWLDDSHMDGVSSLTQMILIGLASIFLPYILAFLAVKMINKAMVRLTRTNQELIEEVRAGQHDAKIPQQFRNEAGIEGIIRTLNGAQASTVRGAAAVYAFKYAVMEAGRSLAQLNRPLFSVARGAGRLLTMGCMNLTDDWMFMLRSETPVETVVRKAATHATIKVLNGDRGKRDQSQNGQTVQGAPPPPGGEEKAGAPRDWSGWMKRNK